MAEWTKTGDSNGLEKGLFEIGQHVEGDLTHVDEVRLKRLSGERRARAAWRTRSVETRQEGQRAGQAALASPLRSREARAEAEALALAPC